jgi:aminopeptidase YwaD
VRPTAESIARDISELTRTSRVVGEPGNASANEYFAARASGCGWRIERIGFPCTVWRRGAAQLTIGTEERELRVGSYSLPFSGTGRLLAVSSVEELERLDDPGAILLLHGAIVAEQLTPKNYPFYAWDSHARILSAIEAAKPSAIIAATGRDKAMVGQLYPFSLIEDADVDVPSAYLTDVEGESLLPHTGEIVKLVIDSGRVHARAEQLIARRDGAAPPELVITAHIDSYRDTPGALDNASGVAVLLALADLLAEESVAIHVELVPINGEDHYSAGGEVAYLEWRGDSLGSVRLAINVDAAGLAGHHSELSLYGCSDDTAAILRAARVGRPGIVDGEQWPQSDHMVFAMRGIPAAALTCEDAARLARTVAHTERDTPDVVDPAALLEIAEYLADVVTRLAGTGLRT